MASLTPHNGALTYIKRVSDAIPLRPVVRVRIVKRKKDSRDMKRKLNIYGIVKDLE